jgi:hypothetical protein
MFRRDLLKSLAAILAFGVTKVKGKDYVPIGKDDTSGLLPGFSRPVPFTPEEIAESDRVLAEARLNREKLGRIDALWSDQVERKSEP